MSEKEEFENLKQRALSENEKQYGEEVREKYGESVVEKANDKFKSMTPQQYADAAELSEAINQALAEAVISGDVEGEAARRCCALHQEWLNYFWPEGMYTPQAHLALAQTYCIDDRFKQYYEAVAPGGAEFLYEALKAYLPK